MHAGGSPIRRIGISANGLCAAIIDNHRASDHHVSGLTTAMSEHSSTPANSGPAAGPGTAEPGTALDRPPQASTSSPGQEVIALVVHELRSPLAAIANILEAYGNHPDPVADPRAREMISRQLHKALRLVDDLLDLTRVASANPSIALTPIVLSQVITDTVQEVAYLIRARRQALILDLPRERLWVRGDAVRLGQVIGNLLENSSKYSAAGGEITLSLACAGSQAVLRVRDNGAGIASADLPRVFDPYFRGNHGHQISAGTPTGLGLGLALTRRLVELHGGTIEAKSDGLGCGSEFTVRLPIDSGLPAAGAEDAQRVTASPKPSDEPRDR